MKTRLHSPVSSVSFAADSVSETPFETGAFSSTVGSGDLPNGRYQPPATPCLVDRANFGRSKSGGARRKAPNPQQKGKTARQLTHIHIVLTIQLPIPPHLRLGLLLHDTPLWRRGHGRSGRKGQQIQRGGWNIKLNNFGVDLPHTHQPPLQSAGKTHHLPRQTVFHWLRHRRGDRQ